MNSSAKNVKSIRLFLINNLPRSIVAIIVKIKGGGVIDHPIYIKSQNNNSLECTIAYN